MYLRKTLFLLWVFGITAVVHGAIKEDEEIIFFPTFARLNQDRTAWTMPIHGWIYEPEKDSLLRNALLSLLCARLDLSEKEAEATLFRERARAFLVDNKRAEKISIRLGEEKYLMEKSTAEGHFEGTITLPIKDLQNLKPPYLQPNHCLRIETVKSNEKERVFYGNIQLIEEKGLSIISDIDDTIKVSEVRDRKALLANTFLKEYQAVPEMAETYQAWEKSGAKFHYVSAGPWQLFSPLEKFLKTESFPAGALHLRRIGRKDFNFLDLFDSSSYKIAAIETILKDFPYRDFILVGDSAEKDPEVYSQIAKKYPMQIKYIFIRDVTPEEPTMERCRKVFQEIIPNRWQVFSSPGQIKSLP